MDTGSSGEDLPTLYDDNPTDSKKSNQPLEVASRSGLPGSSETSGTPGTSSSGNNAQNTGGPAQLPPLPSSDPSDSGVDGTTTHAEQIAILDAELDRATNVFDGIIRDAQAEQRSAEREGPISGTSETIETETASEYGRMPGGTRGSPGSGGGMRSQGASTTASTAKYPPPADIPSGEDDDVIARQLREAAMREADPEVRERLWEEYRKYKGINQG
jgi:hypothetical protein